jgi:Undecaprenyl-phosphate glucose phosphotransferase
MAYGSDFHEHAAQDDKLSLSASTILSTEAVPYFLSTADAFVIVASSILSGIGYQLSVGNLMPSVLPHCAVGLLASFIYVLRTSGSRFYEFPDCAKPRVETAEILVCWFTTGLLLAFFAFLLKIGVAYSRGAFVLFYFLTPIGLLGIRKLTKVVVPAAVSRGAVGRRDVVLVGDFNEISALGPQDRLSLFGAAEVKNFVLSREDDLADRSAADCRIMSDATDFVRLNNCREIILALPWVDSDRIEILRERLKTVPIAVRLLPDMRVRSLTNFASSIGQQVFAIEIQREPLGAAEQLVKRAMDLVLAGLALIFFIPLMVLTSLAIKLDSPGPVIFRQQRNGFNGRHFTMFKFRTMIVQENGPNVTQVTRDDPRVTAIGRLLRSASIDELPQLFNVLKGDMSLIGPRPHALAHDDHFQNILSDYAYRHHVKPGITGWAQCNGARGATPSIEHISERVKLDLWYIDNWSLWLDLQILIKTFFEVLRKRNAY